MSIAGLNEVLAGVVSLSQGNHASTATTGSGAWGTHAQWSGNCEWRACANSRCGCGGRTSPSLFGPRSARVRV